jgi:catechol 2,3-dioxygenase-like lactoylglutathione lyase family enzyme
MPITARFGHTNIIAADWRKLAGFYQTVFGCVPVPPERNLGGEALERGTGIPHATLGGVHLRLPGHGANGPTLEIFTYGMNDALGPGMPNRTGFGHIAFIVPEVEAARQAVLAAGGSEHGALVTTSAGARKVSWIYMRDPEGNLLELQAWHD